jgi:hypothetical protein
LLRGLPAVLARDRACAVAEDMQTIISLYHAGAAAKGEFAS